jgi:hypothetical protein
MTKEQLNEMWEIFRALGVDALSLNHYNLAEATPIHDPQLWKEFLMEHEVSEWIRSELALIQESELNKMIHNISKSRSVGQAQLMNALAKLGEHKTSKDGPTFIYTYVPLNPEQTQAENIILLNHDPFLKGAIENE